MAQPIVLGPPENVSTVKEDTSPIVASGAKRRSTRILQTVPLVISWAGARSRTLLEETGTLSINCHGCQYLSRFRIRKNTRIDVQVGVIGNLGSPPQHFSARVAWIRKSRRLGGMYQVGVEFDTPQNIWHVREAPEDWSCCFPSSATREDNIILLSEVERLLQFAHAGSFYELLGVPSGITRSEVKRRFYHLASRFHPDHHMDHPEWTPRLLELMESLTIAYRTLSDDESKQQYDSRLIHKSRQKSLDTQQSARQCVERSRECLAVKNYIGSILWLRRAIEVEPNSSDYRTLLGHSLAGVPEYRHEAVEQFDKAIEIDPSSVAAHFQYAQMLEQMKLPARARPHYLHVLELDINHREARERLRCMDSVTPRPASRRSLLGRLTGRR